MRIFLVQARLTSCAGNVMPLLNLPALSAYLKRAGYRDIQSLHMDAFPPGEDALERRLLDFSPDIVGIGAMTAQAKAMHETARLVKRLFPKTLVVVGGPHPTHDPQDCVANEAIDVMVLHEGEETLLELVQRREQGLPFDGLKGICFRQNGKMVRNPPRDFIADLDSLPQPDWDSVDFDAYRDFLPCSMLPFRRRAAGIMTSRGCPYQCTFCHHQMGKRFRAQSPARVLEDISILHKKHGINDLEIIDDVFNFDRERLLAILKGIVASGMKLNIYMTMGLRGDLLDEEILDLFHPAGVVFLTVAVESGSPRMQKLLKKNIDFDRMTRVIDYAAKKRIFVHGLFLFGFPEETVSDMWQTVRFVCKSKLHTMMIGTCYGFRGTEMGDALPEGKAVTPDNDAAAFSSYKFVNCSSLSDRRIKAMKFLLNVLFYYNPRRIWRILRDVPFYNADLAEMFFHKIVNKTILFR